MLVAAMTQARDDLTSMQAVDPGKWSWGGLHRLDLENETLGQSGNAAVEALFNRGAYELGGGPGSVNATEWEASEGFEVTAAPTAADGGAARRPGRGPMGGRSGGTSGHAFSSHYNDQTDVWADGADASRGRSAADAVAGCR